MAALSVRAELALPGFRLRVDQAFELQGLTAVFGPSGSGKSTLLRVIAGLERGARGQVRFGDEIWQADGAFVPPHKRGVSLVFQDARLFEHLSVAGNLMFAQKRALRAGRRPERAQVIEALELGALLERRPGSLSGGERQRVAMGRALMAAPRLLLMDEPMAALDETRKAAILPLIEQVRDRLRVPIIHVSHSIAEVARLADTIALMNGGEILRAGAAADILSDPLAMPGLGVRDAGAILQARVVRHHADGITELSTGGGALFLPGVSAAVGSRLRVRIGAQDVIIALTPPEGISALNILQGEIAQMHRGEGPGVAVRIRLAGGECLLARITRRSADALGLKPGMKCHAIAKAVSVARQDVGQNAPAPG